MSENSDEDSGTIAAGLSRPHDAFCKMLLDRPGNADALLRERLPSALVAGLSDRPALDRSAEFIDPDLARNATDRVYMLETLHGESLLIYVTVEHKSRPGREILIQTLRTLSGVAQRAAVERRNPDGTVWLVPAVVLRLVIYNGARPGDNRCRSQRPMPAHRTWWHSACCIIDTSYWTSSGHPMQTCRTVSISGQVSSS